MHEFGIAASIVEIAAQAAAGAGPVEVVRVRLGVLSGVVKESLLFCYDIATKDTPLAGSRLEIEELPVVIYCAACKTTAALPTPQMFECPHCGRPSMDMRQGQELEIVNLVLLERTPDEQPENT